MDKQKTTNILLMILVIPMILYMLKTLSFIFIPLVFSMLLALLFLPFMRWLTSKKIPKYISIFFVLFILVGVLMIAGGLIHYSINEILMADAIFKNAEIKILNLIISFEEYFGIGREQGQSVLEHYINNNEMKEYFKISVDIISSILSMTIMTLFFFFLWLLESINFQKVLSGMFKQKHTSIKVFFKIEKDLIKFVKVKFIISFFTGVGIAFACFYFKVSFPIFWGVFAFAINFVQMIGSIITILLLSLFAFIEIDPSMTLLFFILSITTVQGVFGGIIEPIFMGKSFSINIITILLMLSLWGYIWGIPGLILAIPITVFIKIILEQFPKTKIIANLISAS